LLRTGSAEVAVAGWDAWIKDYLADRVGGVPRMVLAPLVEEALRLGLRERTGLARGVTRSPVFTP
jgi:hypothetical protein